jgi:hypothetical protein
VDDNERAIFKKYVLCGLIIIPGGGIIGFISFLVGYGGLPDGLGGILVGLFFGIISHTLTSRLMGGPGSSTWKDRHPVRRTSIR